MKSAFFLAPPVHQNIALTKLILHLVRFWAFSVAICWIPYSTFAGPVAGTGTWESTLRARDLDGNQLTVEGYFDTVLNVTWLANANYAGGAMTWTEANTWVASLNMGGIGGWRLPRVTDTGAPGCNSSYGGSDCGYNVQTMDGSQIFSEAAVMYYLTLGNLAWYDTAGIGVIPGSGLVNTGAFVGIQNDASVYYWLSGGGTEPRLDRSDHEWVFEFAGGTQGLADEAVERYVWALHDGDVGASVIPVPGTLLLVSLGLLFLAMFRGRFVLTVSHMRSVVAQFVRWGLLGMSRPLSRSNRYRA